MPRVAIKTTVLAASCIALIAFVHPSAASTHATAAQPQRVAQALDNPDDQTATPRTTLRDLFADAIGRDERAEAYFAALLAHDAELFNAVLTDRTVSFDQAYAQKLDDIQKRFAARDRGGPIEPIRLTPEDAAILLLLGAAAKPPVDNATDRRASLEVFRAEIGDVLTEHPWVAQLYNVWAKRLTDDAPAWRAIRRAADLKLDEVLPAARFHATRQRSSASLRAISIVLIGKLGTPRDADVLTPLLDDSRLPRDENFGSTDPMQVRDLALITLLQLNDYDPKSFGYQPKPQRQHIYTDLGFPDTIDRDTAIKVWREQHRGAAETK